jgi:hypothetical protein
VTEHVSVGDERGVALALDEVPCGEEEMVGPMKVGQGLRGKMFGGVRESVGNRMGCWGPLRWIQSHFPRVRPSSILSLKHPYRDTGIWMQELLSF